MNTSNSMLETLSASIKVIEGWTKEECGLALVSANEQNSSLKKQIEAKDEMIALLRSQVEAGGGPNKRAKKAPVEDARAAAARQQYQMLDHGEPGVVGASDDEPRRRRKVAHSTEEAKGMFREWFRAQKVVPSKGFFLSVLQAKYLYSQALPDNPEITNQEAITIMKLCIPSEAKYANVVRRPDRNGHIHNGWCIFDYVIANDEEHEDPEQSLPIPHPGGLAEPTV